MLEADSEPDLTQRQSAVIALVHHKHIIQSPGTDKTPGPSYVTNRPASQCFMMGKMTGINSQNAFICCMVVVVVNSTAP